MLKNITFGKDNAPGPDIRSDIAKLGEFAVTWYTAKFNATLTDLDDVHIKFDTPESSPGRYGAAQDNEQLDVLTIRNDAWNDKGLTARGWDTVAHEWIHFCQYATDFERRYDVPYIERPQEVQAFQYSSELLRAYRAQSIAVAPDKPEVREPSQLTEPKKKKTGLLVLAAVLLAALFFGSALGEPVQDENVFKLRNHVLYNDGTERRYTSVLNDEWRKGWYVDVITGEKLFHSDWKFDSKTGWPSFHTVELDNVELIEDWHPWQSIYEVRSKDGKRHYGHLFLEKQWPEGRRFCINGVVLKFIPDEDL